MLLIWLFWFNLDFSSFSAIFNKDSFHASMGFFSNFCACIEKRLKRSTGETDDDNGGGGTSSDLFFQLQTLQTATNFFSESNLLGRGGFGPVYKVN